MHLKVLFGISNKIKSKQNRATHHAFSDDYTSMLNLNLQCNYFIKMSHIYRKYHKIHILKQHLNKCIYIFSLTTTNVKAMMTNKPQ